MGNADFYADFYASFDMRLVLAGLTYCFDLLFYLYWRGMGVSSSMEIFDAIQQQAPQSVVAALGDLRDGSSDGNAALFVG